MVPLMKPMRQRYCVQLAADHVFTLSSVDVESPTHVSPRLLDPSPLAFCTSAANVSADAIASQSQHRLSCWRHKVEDCLWLASALFILYYGDFRSDFFSLLANDARVWRTPLHMGLACLMLDCCMVTLYIAMSMQAQEESTRLQAPGVIQAVTMLGSLAFILMSIALWPIWNFLTIPMLFTLFMAFTVMAPYILPYMKVKLDLEGPGDVYVRSGMRRRRLCALRHEE